MNQTKMKFQLLAFLIYSIIFQSLVLSQTSYLNDEDFVNIFQGTIVPNSSRDFYWDLSEINNSNSRLDLVVGVTQRGDEPPSAYNYVNGNWYENELDTNFNLEDPDLRFIYEGPNDTNGITGLLFAKLNSSSTVKKEVIVTREDEILYIYTNHDGAIDLNYFQRIFNAQGSVAAVGKFTNDALEDVAVISGSSLKIYKNLGNSKLDTTAVYTKENVYASKVIIAQISNYIDPYSIFKQTTNDKDEIIVRTGSSIKIYKNNNSNGIVDSTTISISSQYADFKVADLNNDGYNDLIVTSLDDGIKIFMNNSGTISTTASYTNTNYTGLRTVAVADFDKDGWNDIIVANPIYIRLFLNSSGSFSQTVSYSKGYNANFRGRKIAVSDLHNKGGLSVIYSGTADVAESEYPDYPWTFEKMVRFNATTKDANPAPAIVFGEVVYVGYYNRPKLYLYDRGNRDFLRFRIYKKSPYVGNVWTLIDSTSNDYYIDYNEIVYNGGGSGDHTLYYTKVVDNSYKVSINSDTLDFETICPSCGSGERLFAGNELPNEYSITNYPNPFNPTTNIKFDLPGDNFVTIAIYDLLGKEIMTLVNENKVAGSYIVSFNGDNLPSGIYYYKIKAGSYENVRKMILLK